MRDFNGKVIKVYLNVASGWLVITGPFIRMESDFLVVRNNANNKIEYISKAIIKYVEIVHELEDKEEE